MKRTAMLLLILLMVFRSEAVFAANTKSTGYTTTLDTDGRHVISQDAYLPSGTLSFGLNGAEDLFLLNDRLYIADTQNARVLTVDLKTEEVRVIGEGILKKPKGVSAAVDGTIYVADIGTKEVYAFSPDGTLNMIFVKPDTPAFGQKAVFAPSKVVPADDGGVYIISEGSTAGIVHMDGTGKFLGYFASDSTLTSWFDRIADLILTEEQKKYFLNKTPPSFQNLFRGEDGLVYSVIKGPGAKLNRHSLSGKNLLNREHVPALDNVQDICVASDGRMFAVTQAGYISELTRDGYLLCSFGGPSDGQEKLGLFQIPSGIGLDSKNQIYVLDQETNLIQIFEPTKNQNSIREAMEAYNQGDYAGSSQILSELLKLNDTSFFAHLYMGKNSMQIGDYETAAYHFKTANSKGDYSEAFWEIRNFWLQEHLLYVLSGGILLWIVVAICRRLGWFRPLSVRMSAIKKKLNENQTMHGLFGIRHAAMHPVDNSYEVKVGRMGTIGSATLLYLLIFIEYVLFELCSGYLFSTPVKDYSIILNFAFFAGAVVLFVAGNHFISSIYDGNGTLRSIYIVTAYSFSFLLFIFPVVTIVSNFMCMNDVFFRNLAMTAGIVLAIGSLFAGLMEIHQYSFRQILKNILLTLFFMAIAVIVLSLFYLLLRQIVMYFYEVAVEVSLRG